MPYKNISEAEEKNPGLKKYSDKAKRGWIGSFNSCMKDGGPEDKCFAIAYSIANDVDGRKKKSHVAKRRIAREWEDIVFQSVADETSAGMAKIIVPWIMGGLTGNKFIVADVKNIKFSYEDNDDMSFSARVYVILPDSGKESWKRYRWRKKGKNYRGVISSEVGDKDIARELLRVAHDIESADRQVVMVNAG